MSPDVYRPGYKQRWQGRRGGVWEASSVAKHSLTNSLFLARDAFVRTNRRPLLP